MLDGGDQEVACCGDTVVLTSFYGPEVSKFVFEGTEDFQELPQACRGRCRGVGQPAFRLCATCRCVWRALQRLYGAFRDFNVVLYGFNNRSFERVS